MDPSLDECNAAIDEIEEMYDYGRDLKVRVMQIEGLYYLGLTWYRRKAPRKSEVYPPVGWVTTRWMLGEDGNWHSAFFRT
jgi:hypothetical protein